MHLRIDIATQHAMPAIMSSAWAEAGDMLNGFECGSALPGKPLSGARGDDRRASPDQTGPATSSAPRR